ncbi:transketolase [bacterium]|nr:transketolase [bacterium]
MGELFRSADQGTVKFVRPEFLRRILARAIPLEAKAAILADAARLQVLSMVARAGSGHLGGSFSSLEILAWLYLRELSPRDIFFSSKGHDAPGHYAVLALGKIKYALLRRFRRLKGLPGHPEIGLPGIHANTGSLGMGISKAKGMILARRLSGRQGRVFVLTGDGELQEGQIWESLASAVHHRMEELTVVVDHNKMQSDTYVSKVSDLGNLPAKFRAFGWAVARCNGHDVRSLHRAFHRAERRGKPLAIIADTIKGKGVSFMEHTSFDSDVEEYPFHSGAPDRVVHERASQEILTRLNRRLRRLGLADCPLQPLSLHPPPPANKQERLIPAYGRALLSLAAKDPNLVVLDADLAKDTGILGFKKLFARRYFECGIAEQDMVSMAGGMALRGKTPVVHSFACFLASRAHEQIFNNATEKTRVVYVGSLAGVLPGGPGPSHQGVRDLATLSGIPGLTILEPSREAEVEPCLRWCLYHSPGPSYLRITSVPFETPPFPAPIGKLRPGQGRKVLRGTRLLVLTGNPVLLGQAVAAALRLWGEVGWRPEIFSWPWMNRVDTRWFLRLCRRFRAILVLDNHLESGGLGDLFGRLLAQGANQKPQLHRLAVPDFPPSGWNHEVLQKVGMDQKSLAEKFLDFSGKKSYSNAR